MLSYELSDKPEPRWGKSSPIQKGLVPRLSRGPDLCEEGLGFGVPILQFWRDFYFPGTAQVVRPSTRLVDGWEKRFQMNLVERYHRRPTHGLTRFSWVVPRLYNWIYKSSAGRQFLGLMSALNGVVSPALGRQEPQPRFHAVADRGQVRTTYRREFRNGGVRIEVELTRVVRDGLQRSYIANELGGSHFTRYWDSRGLHLTNDAISPWHKIEGQWAVLYAPALDWGFRVEIPRGITAFRGREVLGQHSICWSGIILTPPPSMERLTYRVRFGPATSLEEEGAG